MSGMLDHLDARKVARYLPRPLPDSLRSWLGDALLGGRAEQVGFSLEGDLRDFPFRQPEQGHFRVAGRLSDVTLAFLPDWPSIDQINANLTIDRVAVLIDAQSGRMGKVRLSDVSTRISDYSAAVVKIVASPPSSASIMKPPPNPPARLGPWLEPRHHLEPDRPHRIRRDLRLCGEDGHLDQRAGQAASDRGHPRCERTIRGTDRAGPRSGWGAGASRPGAGGI
jgi:hypothetical protein